MRPFPRLSAVLLAAVFGAAESLHAAYQHDTHDFAEVNEGVNKQVRLAIPTEVTVVKGILAVANCAGGDTRADGRSVAFMSSASDLVAGDTNEVYDAFVRDLGTSMPTPVGGGVKLVENRRFEIP